MTTKTEETIDCHLNLMKAEITGLQGFIATEGKVDPARVDLTARAIRGMATVLKDMAYELKLQRGAK